MQMVCIEVQFLSKHGKKSRAMAERSDTMGKKSVCVFEIRSYYQTITHTEICMKYFKDRAPSMLTLSGEVMVVWHRTKGLCYPLNPAPSLSCTKIVV